MYKKLFSITNKQSANNKWYKVIYILGIKFSFRNKKKERKVAREQERLFIINSLNNLANQNDALQKQNNELIYANVLRDCTSCSEWLLKKDFSLTLGAANYSFIFILFKILDNINPKNILEFGLGQTTKLTTQYILNKKQNAILNIIEHNQDWINTFSENLDFTENIKIYHKNLINFELNGINSDKYESLENITKDKKFDLIIIDGPFGYDRIYPRTNVLDLIPNNLSDNFVIVLDDAERKGGKNTAELIFKALTNNNINYKKSYKVGTKTQLIITSTNYEFIHWN